MTTDTGINLIQTTVRCLEVVYREDTCDLQVAESCIFDDEYFFRKFIRAGDVVIDLGGYCGNASILAASLGAQAICVEPIPENVEMIHRNIKANKMEDRIQVIPRAISGTSGEKTQFPLPIYSDPFQHRHRFVLNETHGNPTITQTQDAITISLADVMGDKKKIRIIKCDCEGGEWGAFTGISPDLVSEVDYIIGEFHTFDGRNFNDLLKLIKDLNFMDKTEEYYPYHPMKGQMFFFKNKACQQ